MKMLRDNLLVKQLSREQLGKIVLPESVQDDWCRGKVVGVGPGDFNYKGEKVPLEIKVDDVVVFPPPMGGRYPTVVVSGEEYIILSEKIIWAIEGDRK